MFLGDCIAQGADYADSLMILAGGASWVVREDETVVQASQPCRVFGAVLSWLGISYGTSCNGRILGLLKNMQQSQDGGLAKQHFSRHSPGSNLRRYSRPAAGLAHVLPCLRASCKNWHKLCF